LITEGAASTVRNYLEVFCSAPLRFTRLCRGTINVNPNGAGNQINKMPNRESSGGSRKAVVRPYACNLQGESSYTIATNPDSEVVSGNWGLRNPGGFSVKDAALW